MAAFTARCPRNTEKSSKPVFDNDFYFRQQVHSKRISNAVQQINPAVASFYRLKALKRQATAQAGQSSAYKLCSFCGSPFLPDNHRIRVLPRQRFTPKIRRLMQRYAESPTSLGKFQLKLVKQQQDGCTRMSITCFTCKKTLKFAGQSRDQRRKQLEESYAALAVPVEDLPKTRKDKMKERKKLMKRKKKARGNEMTVDAGLTLTRAQEVGSQNCERFDTQVQPRKQSIPHSLHTGTSVAGTQGKIQPTFSNQTDKVTRTSVEGHMGGAKTVSPDSGIVSCGSLRQFTGLVIDAVSETSANISVTEKKRGQVLPIAINTNSVRKPVKSKLNKQTESDDVKRSSAGPVMGKMMNPSGSNTHTQSGSGSGRVNKQAGKKHRARNLSQQLGNILKQETKKKSGEATLADFLSSL